MIPQLPRRHPPRRWPLRCRKACSETIFVSVAAFRIRPVPRTRRIVFPGTIAAAVVAQPLAVPRSVVGSGFRPSRTVYTVVERFSLCSRSMSAAAAAACRSDKARRWVGLRVLGTSSG